MDIMMPGLDGWEVCSGIRRLSDVPIIFLTAKTGEGDMLRGFDLGAVDYVTKPFSIKVLLARAEAALRQGVGRHDSREVTGYDDGYLQVDLAGRLVRVNRQRVRLTQTEYRLLSVLVRNAGQVLSYEQILEHVWGWEYRDSPNYVHVYIRRLRQKLERDPGAPAYLLTERGVGYAFVRQTVY
jgi:DNA-binding response OmpR family regulator